MKSARFLQPLSILKQEFVGMVFTTRLVKVGGKSSIYAVFNQLTKNAHFIALDVRSIDQPSQVAELFMQHIYKLNGLPKIVIDWNLIFMSNIMSELSIWVGIISTPSTNYHHYSMDKQRLLTNVWRDIWFFMFQINKPFGWHGCTLQRICIIYVIKNFAIHDPKLKIYFGREQPSKLEMDIANIYHVRNQVYA